MTVENCQALLKSRKTDDRLKAMRLIGRLPAEERISLLRQALNDKSNYVASLAAEMLTRAEAELLAEPDEATLAAMVERFLQLSEDGLKRDPGCHVRTKLAFAFGRYEYSPAIHALRIGIHTVQMESMGGLPFDTGAQLRVNCALALAQMNAPDAILDIAPLLFDTGRNAVGANPESPAYVPSEIRKGAAQALALLSPSTALIPLTIKLRFPGSESADVLQECMQAIVQLEDPRSLELLEPYLTHSDAALAAYAALMIAQSRVPEAPGLLAETARRLSGNPQTAVILALVSLRSDAVKPALLSLADDARQSVRFAVVAALADSHDELSREILAHIAANDGVKSVRAAAQKSLEGNRGNRQDEQD